jgi:ribonuclease VapC
VTIPVAVDSSVLIAILNEEPETEAFLGALAGSNFVIGWPTIFEVRIWCHRRLTEVKQPWLEAWFSSDTTRIVAFDGELEALASDAYGRFGKGRHPAGLNFGDCMAYAVARWHDAPLLFKGGDFARTDIAVHPASVVPA